LPARSREKDALKSPEGDFRASNNILHTAEDLLYSKNYERAFWHKASNLGLVPEIACRLGRALKWDSVKEQFIDDREANLLMTRPLKSP
jgi:hypothetical protein